MPRRPRFNLIDIPQHVIQRGNNRSKCFFDDLDYKRYLDDLRKSSEKYGCNVHAYVLMTNHVHLLVTPTQEYAISNMMQSIGRRYVKYFNNKYERTGTLWEGRFKSNLVQSERYLLNCMQYIELNPVRANIVTKPENYSWSSYAANALGKQDLIVSRHELYSSPDDYRAIFNERLSSDTSNEIEHALSQELVLGTSEYKDSLEEQIKRRVRLKKPGRPKVCESTLSYITSI